MTKTTATATTKSHLHPSTAALLEYFEYAHLPHDLQLVAVPFCNLANDLAAKTSGPETTAGLRKLLEAKDCLVRARLNERNEPDKPGE